MIWNGFQRYLIEYRKKIKMYRGIVNENGGKINKKQSKAINKESRGRSICTYICIYIYMKNELH